ncbi:C-type lectin domain family 10 member A, partial [Biomphalaria glabrata]
SGDQSLYENELKREISETATHALHSLFFYPSFGQGICGLVGGYLVEVNTIQELEFIKHFVFEKASHFVLVMAGGTDEDHEGLWINGYSLTKVDSLWDSGTAR